MEKFKTRGRGRVGALGQGDPLRGTRGGGVRGRGAGAAYHYPGGSQRHHFATASAAATAGPVQQAPPYWAGSGRRMLPQQPSMPPPPPPPWHLQRPPRGGGSGGRHGRGGVVRGGRVGKTRYGSGGGAGAGMQTRRRSATVSAGQGAAAGGSVVSSDPLNLRWVMAESQRRQLAGLSPMPGDSAINSPAGPEPGTAGAAGTDETVEEAAPIVPEPLAADCSGAGDPAAATNFSGAQDAEAISSGIQHEAAAAKSGPATDLALPSMPTTPVSSAVAAPSTPTTPGGAQVACSSPYAGLHFQPIYGNYRANYGRQMRAGELNIGQMQDDRLQLLQPDWYTDKDVLDIGCNDGVFSLKIAESLGVRSLTGVDIDEELVQMAERNLRGRIREADEEARVKMSLLREGFQADSSVIARTGFPYNVKFLAANYVPESEAHLTKCEENKYDIIQAFSITKWIHLNWGDRGLKLFFRRAFRELKPDGKFIVEPQPYQAYKRTLLCPAHKQNYATNIALRPDQFKEFLEREVGFAHILSVWEQQQRHGFQRPVLMCSKPTGQTPALGRDASQHNFRLFVPPHPLRSQLDPSPYLSDSTDTFYIAGGGGDFLLMEADEGQEAAAAAVMADMRMADPDLAVTAGGDAASEEVVVMDDAMVATTAGGDEAPEEAAMKDDAIAGGNGAPVEAAVKDDVRPALAVTEVPALHPSAQ